MFDYLSELPCGTLSPDGPRIGVPKTLASESSRHSRVMARFRKGPAPRVYPLTNARYKSHKGALCDKKGATGKFFRHIFSGAGGARPRGGWCLPVDDPL